VGVARDVLRFFGRAGLLPDVSADADATPEYCRRLRFIQRAPRLGFELHEIRDLLSISDGGSRDMKALRVSIETQIESVEERIVALMRVRQALLRTQERLDRRRPQTQCPILAALQDESGG